MILHSDAWGPRDVPVEFVTGTYFSTLGVGTHLGRPLRGSDGGPGDDPQLDAVISHSLWETRFESSDSIIGTVVRLNRQDVRIVGVAPPRFAGAIPDESYATAFWIPMSARAAMLESPRSWQTDPDTAVFTVFGRLAPGVTREQVTPVAREVGRAANARRASPAARTEVLSAVVRPLRSNLMAEEPTMILLLAGISAGALLILLVTCTNVSSLLVASAVSRRHEIAVRLSLGASRWRVVRQLVTESSLLAVVGAALGVVLYGVLMHALLLEFPSLDLSPSPGTLAFTLGFAVATGILFGLSPALHGTRGIANAVKDSASGSRRSRLQGGFVVAQIALTQPLLVLLGFLLFAATTVNRKLPSEEVAERVIDFNFEVNESKPTAKARFAAIRAAMDRVAQEPGVISIVPDPHWFSGINVTIPDEERATAARWRRERATRSSRARRRGISRPSRNESFGDATCRSRTPRACTDRTSPSSSPATSRATSGAPPTRSGEGFNRTPGRSAGVRAIRNTWWSSACTTPKRRHRADHWRRASTPRAGSDGIDRRSW